MRVYRGSGGGGTAFEAGSQLVLLLLPLFLFLQDATRCGCTPHCASRGCRSARREVPSQMGPSDLHKAVLSSTHTGTRWPLLLSVRARLTHTRPLY